MYKAIVLLKRKSGMSMDDFIAYYESHHAPLALSKVPNFTRYVRHFIRPYGNDVYAGHESPYDVLTEIWFEDQDEFTKAMALLAEPETAAIIGADEENLFDRSAIQFMIMEDHESDLREG